MKRLAAIPILMLFLFNWVGYQLYTTIARNLNTQSMITRLDNEEFPDSELISIKVPAVHMTPYTVERDFERVNGQIEIGSRVFNYVKRKITQDSLEFLCIPNDQASLLRIANLDFFKLVADLQAEQSKKTDSNNSNTFKTHNGAYFEEDTNDLLSFYFSESLTVGVRDSSNPTSGFSDFNGQPPEFFR